MKKFLLFTILNFGLLSFNCFAQQHKIDSLLILLKADKADTNKVNHLNALGRQLMYQDPDTAVILGNLALKIITTISSREPTSMTEDADEYWIKVLRAKTFGNLGVYYCLKADYFLSLEYSTKALKIYEKIKDKKGIIQANNNIGNIYFEQSSYPNALDYYFKALKLDEELKNKGGVAGRLCNIGNIYSSQGEYSKALECFFKSLKMAEELGNKNLIANDLGNIGKGYYNQMDYPQALNYFFRALKMVEKLENKSGMIVWLGNIGAVYFKQGDYSKALDYYFRVLKMSEELGDKKNIAVWLGNIGSFYTEMGKFKEAERYLKKAVDMDKSIGAMSSLLDAEEYLSQLYDTTRRYKEAIIHYKKSVELKDTIFSQENRKQLVRKAMNYEFDKKTTEINAENEKQQAIAAEKNRQQKIIIWSVLIGLLLVVVFSGFVFRSLRRTRKQKSTIEIQKNEVLKQKEVADNQRIIAEGLREVSEKQKELVEEKQKEIIQSITYAKRIQTALLTSDGYVKEHLPAEHFVLFKPKDIVSGDFYWAISIAPFPGWDMGSNKIKLPSTTKKQNIFYMMTADCTGHGVPGAFMSMLNISYLHENIVERGIRLPHDILNSQRKEIIAALNPVGSLEESKDGMDCSLCVYDFDKMLLHFAAANNPLWLVRNQELIEYKADKMPVGKYSEKMESFTLQTIALQKGDVIYTSTDGFADQFGVTGKKLMKKKMKEELLKIHQLPMNEQKEYLDHFFESWKGDNEQVDDVCVIGIRI